MATIDVKDAANTTQTLERPLAPGQAAMAASRPVVIASNQSAVPVSGTVTANAGTGTMTVSVTSLPTTPAGTNNIGDVDVLTLPTLPQLPAALTAGGALKVELPASQIETGKYKAFPNTVSTTTTLNGAGSGATGDFLSTVTIVPETLNPGSISIKDGSGTAIVIFAGGTGSVLSLVPFTVNLGYTSTLGAWQIVTGSGGNVHGVCGGNFT